jgi:hypothetical protein
VTPCSTREVHWCFERTLCLYLQGRRVSQASNEQEESNNSSTMKMEAVDHLNVYRTAWRQIPDPQVRTLFVLLCCWYYSGEQCVDSCLFPTEITPAERDFEDLPNRPRVDFLIVFHPPTHCWNHSNGQDMLAAPYANLRTAEQICMEFGSIGLLVCIYHFNLWLNSGTSNGHLIWRSTRVTARIPSLSRPQVPQYFGWKCLDQKL